MGLFKKIFTRSEKENLDKGLEKTKENFLKKVGRAVVGKSKVDEEVLDDLEDALISADVGVKTTVEIIHRIEERVERDKYMNAGELQNILREEIADMLVRPESEAAEGGFDFSKGKKPYVILVVGVNGVGKTTTIGKLAYQFKNAGKLVVLGAADTFRAAAVEQLTIWSERVGVPIVKHKMGSDPAAVAFDAVESGVARDADIILIDTAGRLHNKKHLMEELSKIRRVIAKVIPDAPHDVMLVLDGSTGQNALEQAKQFIAATDVTSLAITKLDGTAKGGVVLAIANQFKIPVKYIGIGEKPEHLQAFNAAEFVDSLFKVED